MKKSTALSTAVSEESLALLRESYPVETTFQRIMLPRLGLVSQDVTEGKGKAMKVVTEAGTFYTEKQTDELDENDKKIWEKEEIGIGIEGIVLFQRKQLRFYDSSNETYTSSPIYDNDEEVIPLFCNKQEVDRGTPAELKAKEEYQGLSAKGKPISKLEDNRILYVLYNGEVYQMNLRGTSMYAFKKYASTTLPNSVVTAFGSEAKENGSISWSQMTFQVSRQLNQKEANDIIKRVQEIKEAIMAEKGQYAPVATTTERLVAKEVKNF